MAERNKGMQACLCGHESAWRTDSKPWSNLALLLKVVLLRNLDSLREKHIKVVSIGFGLHSCWSVLRSFGLGFSLTQVGITTDLQQCF